MILPYVTSSVLLLLLSIVFLFLPWIALYQRSPRTPRVFLLLAVAGIYCVAVYLKPSFIPLWSLPLAFATASGISLFYSGVRGTEFLEPLREPAVWGIVLYSFLLFFFRWEPPGTDPSKWGALARIIYETGMIPGDTRPLTLVTNLQGANLGLPILIAIFSVGRWVPLERSSNFFECFSVVVFCFSLASGLTLWFHPKAAVRAAFAGLIFFTSIQGYLTWGGTPTLMGMTAGFTCLALCRPRNDEKSAVLLALALAYAAYAHPIGVYLSLFVCGPVGLWELLRERAPLSVWIRGGKALGLAALFFSPFLLHWGFHPSSDELAEVWAFQKSMSPFLFRQEHSLIYNWYIQLTSYLWNTAGVIAFLLLAGVAIVDRRARFLPPALLMIGLIVILVDNVRYWWLPLSFLIYPERAATLLVFPLACPVAWLFERQRTKGAFVVLAVILVLSAKQFSRRLYPVLFQSVLTTEDRRALRWVEANIPNEDCIEITMGQAGMWIPVVAFRCTLPFHGLGMNVLDEERSKARPTRWQYVGKGEGVSGRGTLVYDDGARIYRK
jgi:hypothetical protein